MPKFHLTEQQKTALEFRHKKSRNARECVRIKAVLLRSESGSPFSIAQVLRKSEFTMCRHLNDEKTEQLIDHRSDYTYAHTYQIATYIADRWGIKYTVSGLNKWLHQKGFAYKKLKDVPHKTDTEKQAEFAEHYKTLKASLPKDDVVLFMDAVHPTQATKITSGWIKKGVDSVINTTGSRTRLNILRAIDLNNLSAAIFDQFKTVNGKAIIEFFSKVRAAYASTSVIHIVLDGAGYHRSIPIAFQIATLLSAFAHPDYLLFVGSRGFALLSPSSNLKSNGYKEVVDEAEKRGIELHYLPPYSPNLNPIERLWKVMNDYARNNKYFATAKDFRQKINRFLDVTLPEIGVSLTSRINDNFQKLNPAL